MARGFWTFRGVRTKTANKNMSKILDSPLWNAATRSAMTAVALQSQSDELAHAAEIQRKQRAADQKQLADLERQAEWHRSQRQKELAAEAENARKKESENLDATIRERYFAANSFALESDYLRDKDKLRSEYMLERVEKRKTAEEMLRATSIRM